MANKFYITTPIYYVNDRPHIGHAYTTIVADTIARHKRARGYDVVFEVGADENSQKTVLAAEKAGKSVEEYLREMAGVWRSAWDALDISYTDFIRTTEDRHKETVYEFWRRLAEQGDIYKGKYEGLYCVGHEAFLKESDLTDGLCSDHQKPPERLSEENYFFRLSKYQKALLDHYAAHPDFVVPESRFREVKNFVTAGLEDISISRETQKWGIPVPSDQSHVIYVWFDALVNYATVVGLDGWKVHPADAQTVGKDILRFHAVIWPAMLLSAGLPLPRQVFANGFFTVGGLKMGKSLGNVVDPLDLAKTYGTDALRYFLLREIPYGEDGDFSEAKFKERYTADLAHGLGNLVSRVAALGEKVGDLDLPVPAVRDRAYSKDLDELMGACRFHEILGWIWDKIAELDREINTRKPWEKSDNALREDVRLFAGAVVDINAHLYPFLPDAAAKISEQFKAEGNTLRIRKGAPLFPRIL